MGTDTYKEKQTGEVRQSDSMSFGEQDAMSMLRAESGLRPRSLSNSTTQMMSDRLGVSMSGLRVFENANLSDIGETAFAQGNEIHVAKGKFNQDSAGGREILMHEAAHVAQQGMGLSSGMGDHAGLEAQARQVQHGGSLPHGGASFSMPASAVGAPAQGFDGFGKMFSKLKEKAKKFFGFGKSASNQQANGGAPAQAAPPAQASAPQAPAQQWVAGAKPNILKTGAFVKPPQMPPPAASTPWQAGAKPAKLKTSTFVAPPASPPPAAPPPAIAPPSVAAPVASAASAAPISVDPDLPVRAVMAQAGQASAQAKPKEPEMKFDNGLSQEDFFKYSGMEMSKYEPGFGAYHGAMKELGDNWKKSMSNEERYAVMDYSRDGIYDAVQGYLRNDPKVMERMNDKDKASVEEISENLSKGLERSRTTAPDTVVNRGVGRGFVEHLLANFGQNKDDMKGLSNQELMEAMLKAHSADGAKDIVHQDKGFMSASIEYEQAAKFANAAKKNEGAGHMLEIHAPKGTKAGFLTEDLSQFAFEKELLFDKNQKYLIEEVKDLEEQYGKGSMKFVLRLLSEEDEGEEK